MTTKVKVSNEAQKEWSHGKVVRIEVMEGDKVVQTYDLSAETSVTDIYVYDGRRLIISEANAA